MTSEQRRTVTAAAAAGSTSTVKECLTVISAIMDIKNRDGLTSELWDRLSAVEAEKKELSDAAFDRHTPRLSSTQRWDDDAPDGVVYE